MLWQPLYPSGLGPSLMRFRRVLGALSGTTAAAPTHGGYWRGTGVDLSTTYHALHLAMLAMLSVSCCIVQIQTKARARFLQ